MIEVLDGRPHLRPCLHIPPEGNEGQDWSPTPIAQMYDRVTRFLPLAGADAMAQSRSGAEPRLVAALRDEAPWMAATVDRIAEQVGFSVWAGKPWLAFRPLLLVGPPGAGKSFFARRMGELSGCGSAILSFAGVGSNAELAGNPRGYKHMQPAFPVCAIQRFATANPVIVIDEVEKAAPLGHGDPVATLLTLLEPGTARQFYDGCLAAEVDLSAVNWVLTANSVRALPAPLLSRVDVVECDGPGPDHAGQVLATLWFAVASEAGLPPSALPPLEPAAEARLLQLFRKTRSVRRLRRAVQAVVAAGIRAGGRVLN